MDWPTYEKLVLESAHALKNKYWVSNVAYSILLIIACFLFDSSLVAIVTFVAGIVLNQAAVFVFKRRVTHFINEIAVGQEGRNLTHEVSRVGNSKSRTYHESKLKPLLGNYRDYIWVGCLMLLYIMESGAGLFSGQRDTSFFDSQTITLYFGFVLLTILVATILYSTTIRKERKLREKRDQLI